MSLIIGSPNNFNELQFTKIAKEVKRDYFKSDVSDYSEAYLLYLIRMNVL